MASTIATTRKTSPTTIAPTPHGADALEISKQLLAGHNVLYLARDAKRASTMAQQMRYIMPECTILDIPAWDCLPYDRVSPAAHITSQRIQSLCNLAHTKTPKQTLVISTINASLQKIPPREALSSLSYDFVLNQRYQRDTLIHFLINAGYIRNSNAHEAGEFAVRGSIIDIVPTGESDGYRLDFFDDILESIRRFNPLTQISHEAVKHISITPASEITLDDTHIEQFKNNYRSLFGTVSNEDLLYHAILEKRHYPGMEHWLPLFYTQLETLFDYTSGFIPFLDYLSFEAKDERLEIIRDYYQARTDHSHNQTYQGGPVYHALTPSALYLTDNEWERSLKQAYIFSPYNDESAKGTHYQFTPNFLSESKVQSKNTIEFFKEFTTSTDKPILIACHSEGTQSRLQTILKEHEVNSTVSDNWQKALTTKKKQLTLMVFPLEKGFSSEHYYFISEQDLLGEKHHRRAHTQKRSKNFLQEAAALTPGELVVHKEHGIGRFIALETLTISEAQHDCLHIEYHGGDKLYVPVEYIDLLTRYGNDSEIAQLDKLGGANWQARKAKLKKRLKIIAEELIALAAKRELSKAPTMTESVGLYEEFCAHFPYTETDDQLNCLDDVRNDLHSGRPMDRLICGDVGFGKTEIALRAAFLCSSNQTPYQVAMVAPTTLLARQHYLNFKQRFEPFPLEVRMLSRLTPPSEAKKIREGLKSGSVDIVIGTHTLLAKNVEFKNLGLVVIDEEQQFGVAQKEKFKQLRANIHMLTLTATPIPRTLQMSLTGIKDLSIIATPPVDRLTIRSFTMPFDAVVIRNAILREYYRGGGVFVVVPRISDLEDMQTKLKKIIPEVKIAVAHGQLAPETLDNTMTEFCDSKYDVLISTNIIGAGLDIPRVNTIIVHKADLFGLAQLYQMRGRVGRGKIRAYAYFTLPARKKPTPAAVKRLEIMQSLDSLGAGFTLASHDMDMRGFGNLVGDEQSGNIKEVGVELYQDMLNTAVEAIKDNGNDTQDEDWTPQINLGLPVLIPEAYIEDLEIRMGLYRRIATLKSQQELDEITIELVDRFGPIPTECENLLLTIKAKLLCLEVGVSKVDLGPKGMLVTFYQDSYKDPQKLIEFIGKNPTKVKLRGDQKLVFFCENLAHEEKVPFLLTVLQKLA